MSKSLLVRAAVCYQRAGWSDDACRCFEGAGKWAQAAQIYEEQERWAPAARAYRQAGAWGAAACCYLSDGRPAEAAECLLRGGDVLEAAWVLAERVHRYGRARAVIAELAVTSPAATLARELILARCEAGSGEPEPAARRLRRAIAELGELEPGAGQRRVADWAGAVATSLRRPDLAALVHAAATRAEIPGAAERWERWAGETLGEAVGIPLPEAEAEARARGPSERAKFFAGRQDEQMPSGEPTLSGPR